MNKTKETQDTDPVTRFEQDLQALDAIVQQLEQAELPLDASIKLFEQGMALSQQCKAALDTATQRVERLSRDDSATE
jgi:exodeoxyribonuclease VII small subunit